MAAIIAGLKVEVTCRAILLPNVAGMMLEAYFCDAARSYEFMNTHRESLHGASEAFLALHNHHPKYRAIRLPDVDNTNLEELHTRLQQLKLTEAQLGHQAAATEQMI
eukprot:scaffold220361_cov33-Prasinocladus_malaysianus.AAC.1